MSIALTVPPLSLISTGGATAPVVTPNAALDPFGSTMTAAQIDLGATAGSSQASSVAEVYGSPPGSAASAHNFQFSFWARTVSGTGTLYASIFSWWGGPGVGAFGTENPLTETWTYFTGSMYMPWSPYPGYPFGLFLGPIDFSSYYYPSVNWLTPQPPDIQPALSFYIWGLTFTASNVAVSVPASVASGAAAPVYLSVTDAMTGAAVVGYSATLSSIIPGCTFTQPPVTDSSGNATGYITAPQIGLIPVAATGSDGAVGNSSFISGSGSAFTSLTQQNTDGGFVWAASPDTDPVGTTTAHRLDIPAILNSCPPGSRQYDQVYIQPISNSPIGTVSFWARSRTTPCTLYAFYQTYTSGGGGGYMRGNFPFSLTTDWQLFSYTYNFPYAPYGAGSTYLLFGFDNYNYGVPDGAVAQGVVMPATAPAISTDIWGVSVTYPAILALSSANPMTSVGAAYPVSIHVTDPISSAVMVGYQVTLTASVPGCTFIQPAVTDASGNAIGYVSCPVAGTNIITATNPDGASKTLSYNSCAEYIIQNGYIERAPRSYTDLSGGKANATPLIYNPWWN